jgi:TetR/AcrR family transcriptional regulator
LVRVAKIESPDAPGQTTEGQSSRVQLLSAASALMTERGTVEISLSEIAERSGLNAALIKYYFGSKRGFLLALLEQVLGGGAKKMESLLAMNLDPIEKLKLHITGIINIYYRHPYINRLLHHLLEDSESALKVSEMVSKPVALSQRKLVEEGVARGLFKPIDPTLLYFIVIGACEHLFYGQQILKLAFGIERIDDKIRKSYTEALLEILLGGIVISPALGGHRSPTAT